MAEAHSPDTQDQREFWDEWNSTFRRENFDDFMKRQNDVALEWVRAGGPTPKKILEVGCGTGWLSNSLSSGGSVVATDLSVKAIELASANYPHIEFIAGDFMAVNLSGPFDLVVSADVISHVADQERFISHIASLMKSGGIFLLMTQNGFVWHRSSYLMPQRKGQIRNWPSLALLKRLMADQFEIVKISSIVPGGDRGVFRVVNHRIVRGLLRRIMGEPRRIALYEWLRVGRELVVVARRR